MDSSRAVGRAALTWGHGCFGEPGGVAALGRAPAWAPGEDIFLLAVPGAWKRLAETFAFVLSAFPCKEQPRCWSEGVCVCVGAGLLTSPSSSPLPPCLFHFGVETPSIFCCKEELLIKNSSLPGCEMLCGWWDSAGKHSRSLGVFGSVLMLLFPSSSLLEETAGTASDVCR